MFRRIDISHKTIFFITGFLLTLWALYQIREVIIILFIAIILMSALYPIVGFMAKYKIPKTLSITLAYLVIIGIIGGLVSLVITPLIEQTTNLLTNLPSLSVRFLPQEIDRSVIQGQINDLSKNALSLSLTIFNNILALISVLVLTFYLLLERDNLDKLIGQFFIGKEERIGRITRKIEDKLGAWLRGQIVLSLIIGSLVYLMLFVFNIPYALPLAILAGFMEVIPVIGPIISAIPAIVVALVTSPVLALIVAVGFFVIQQLENNLIVPQVMRKAVGLNPLVVILAVAIGGKLLGIAGALLAVPITVVLQIITEDVLKDEDFLKEN